MIFDQITVRELGLYIDTGLHVRINGDSLSCEFEGLDAPLHGGEAYAIIERRNEPLRNFKPIVRPLSDLEKEITHQGETFIPLHRMKIVAPDVLLSSKDQMLQHERLLRGIQKGYASFNQIKRLVSWGFDVNNWLGRVGQDGEPLALVMPQ